MRLKSIHKIKRGRIYLCHYCRGTVATTVDHIVPRALGGPNKRWNVVPACQPCNVRKGSAPPTCLCDICAHAVRLSAELHRGICGASDPGS